MRVRSLNYSCAKAPDGCGGTLDCGICTGRTECTKNHCTGCDGVEGSGVWYDRCGVCGGVNRTCLSPDIPQFDLDVHLLNTQQATSSELTLVSAQQSARKSVDHYWPDRDGLAIASVTQG